MKKLILILGFILAGCASNATMATSQNTDSKMIEQKTYKIESITLKDEGDMLEAPQNATMGFEEDRIYGNAGCNNYFASIKWADDNTLEISQGGSTKMMCADEEANSFEYNYLSNLNGTFSVSSDDNTITLDNDKLSVVITKGE